MIAKLSLSDVSTLTIKIRVVGGEDEAHRIPAKQSDRPRERAIEYIFGLRASHHDPHPANIVNQTGGRDPFGKCIGYCHRMPHSIAKNLLDCSDFSPRNKSRSRCVSLFGEQNEE